MVKTQKSNKTEFELPQVISEGERNNTIFKYGASLKGKGMGDFDIRCLMQEANSVRCVPPMSDEEVGKIVRSVLSLRSGKPIGTGAKTGDMPEMVDAGLAPTEQAALQLESLFSAEEGVGFITKFGVGMDGRFIPNGKVDTRMAHKVIGDLRRAGSIDEVFPGYDKQAGILFFVNPMKWGGRKNEDVTAFRNTLIEYDDIPKEEQVRRILDSGLPVLSMVDSGNKSVHSIVRIDAKNASEYKEKVAKLHKALGAKYGSFCDKANKNPARMTRLAGAQRGGGSQTLLYTEVNLGSSVEDFLRRSDEAAEKKAKPGHNEVARILMKDYGACFVEGVPAVKSGGVLLLGEDAVHKAVLGIEEDANTRFRKEVVAYLGLMAPKRAQAAPRYMRFKNGILDLDTLELLPNDGKLLVVNEIPHNWNPDAVAPLVDEAFDGIALGDPNVVANLWEMFGVSMYRGHEISRMFLLQGGGANGKSTLLNMLKRMLGEDNCFSLSVQDLGEKFQLVPAVGKLALIGDDIASDYVGGKACAVMKKFVTGETVSDQHKGGATFQFEPYATLIYSCNEIPRFADSTFGLERRVHPIPLSARFTPADEGYDPFLGDKLCEEECLEYAIFKAVEALRECRIRVSLTPNRLSEEMKGDILQESNPIVAYISEKKRAGFEFLGKRNSEVYEDYVKWCGRMHIDPVVVQTLSKTLCLREGMKVNSSNGVRTYALRTA